MPKHPSRDGTKRELIAKMLLDADSDFSVQQIAAKLGTTKGNVWKEKSILRSMGILEKHNMGVFSGTAEGDTIAVARSETKMLVQQTSYRSLTDLPPLDKEELKQLYIEFKCGKSPSDIIAENGFHPTLVEYEHKRFIRLNNLDIPRILRQLISKFSLKDDRTLIPVLQKIEKNGIPSTQEMEMVFDSVERSSYLEGEKSVIERMNTGEPIYPYTHFQCEICHQPIVGAMTNGGTEIGRNIRQVLWRPVHSECNNRGGIKAFR
jgi:hypothetical protein